MDGHLKEEGREEGRERAGYRGFDLKSVNNLMVWVTRKNKISPNGRLQHLEFLCFGWINFEASFSRSVRVKLRARRWQLEMTFNGEITYSRAPGKIQLTRTASELTLRHYLGKPLIIHNYEMHILLSVDISITLFQSRVFACSTAIDDKIVYT